MAALGAAGDASHRWRRCSAARSTKARHHRQHALHGARRRGGRGSAGADPEGPEPAVASLVSSAWLREGMQVGEQGFLDGLAEWFGSGVFEVDFLDEAGAREP